jgi:hypothetical protein
VARIHAGFAISPVALRLAKQAKSGRDPRRISFESVLRIDFPERIASAT